MAAVTDHRLFEAYEIEDEGLANSTRATLTAEFIHMCRAVKWMAEMFADDAVYGVLCKDISTAKLDKTIEAAMALRASFSRKARRSEVSATFKFESFEK